MTLGPDLVLACPSCGALVRTLTLASGNTFGATLWSDGFFDAPMLLPAVAVTQCTAGHWFWLADAEEVGSMWHFSDVPAAWTDAPTARTLTVDAATEALAAGLGSAPDREAFLRLRLWWAANDAYRGTDAAPAPDRDNLERFQALQNDAAPDELTLDDVDWDDEDASSPDRADDDGEDARTELGDPVLRAAVAHALGQAGRARRELASAELPPEWAQAFAAAINRGEHRVVALS